MQMFIAAFSHNTQTLQATLQCKQLSKTYLNERSQTQMSPCVITILKSRKVIHTKSVYSDKRQISGCLSPRAGEGDSQYGSMRKLLKMMGMFYIFIMIVVT